MRIKRQDPHSLFVGMTGVKLGDQVIQFGCANGAPLAAVAAKVGLSGRAVAVVDDDAAAARVQKAAAKAGVLVEVEPIREPARLPFDAAIFDLAIVDDTDGLFAARRAEERAAIVRELLRVVRPGGRAMMIGRGQPQGLSALFSRSPNGPSYVASGQAMRALEADGFRGVRTLAEREGLVFVEGIKPRTVG